VKQKGGVKKEKEEKNEGEKATRMRFETGQLTSRKRQIQGMQKGTEGKVRTGAEVS